jgi:hypothetical protein
VIRELEWAAFLTAESDDEFARPTPELLERMSRKAAVNSERAVALIQDIIGQYIADWTVPERRKLFLSSQFPKYRFRRGKMVNPGKLRPERWKRLMIPNVASMREFVANLLELRERKQ